MAAIVALGPDLVVVNDEENRREDADALRAAGLALHVISIDGRWPTCTRSSIAPGRRRRRPAPEPWEPPRRPPARRRAFVPIWRRPWMSLAGRHLRRVAAGRAGHRHAVRRRRRPATRRCRWPRRPQREPDLVVAPSEPYPFGERHRAELEAVAPVVLVDGQDLFWWGGRTPAALARLSGTVRPDLTGPRGPAASVRDWPSSWPWCGSSPGPVDWAPGARRSRPRPGSTDARSSPSRSRRTTSPRRWSADRQAIRLSFETGRLSVSAGCNILGGSYRLEAGVLRLDQISSTAMGCDEPDMAQDQWLVGVPAGGPDRDPGRGHPDPVRRDDRDPVPRPSGGRPRRVARRDARGRSTRSSSTPAPVSVPVGVTAPTVTFGADGQAVVFDGCNTDGGPDRDRRRTR